MKRKRQQLFFVFESRPLSLIFSSFIIKRIDDLIILYDELAANIWNAQISFCVLSDDRIKLNGSSAQTDKAFYFWGIFGTEPSCNTATKRMIHYNCIFESVQFNQLIDFIRSAIHRHFEEFLFDDILGLLFLLLLPIKERRKVSDNFAWKFQPAKLVRKCRNSTD